MSHNVLDCNEAHRHWMSHALELAAEAGRRDEVPVGAVLVKDGVMLGSGYNASIASHDPSAHAEIIALRDAGQRQQNYRLPDSTLYVTIEPCTMCIGALIHARVALLVFGAREPKAGAVVSRQQLISGELFNHQMDYIEGVMSEECAALIQQFFREKRGF